METRTLSTGHVATLDLEGMTLTLSGDTETMDSIPDAELLAMLDHHGLSIADAIDEVTYSLG